LEEVSQLELDLGSKPPREHFPRGSEMKGESKTPQAGGHYEYCLGPRTKGGLTHMEDVTQII